MTWYFPSWTGDFRLVPIEDSTYRTLASGKKCVLEIIDPTEGEKPKLEAFLKQAVEKKWTEFTEVKTADVNGQQKQDVLLDTTFAEAGKLLVSILKPADRTITAIQSENGKLVVHETAELAKAELAEVEKPATKAVSVARATPSCPQCVPGAIDRASEVLLSFLTEEEHESWARERYIVVNGGLTGNRYMLAHRRSRIAAKVGRICYDLDDEIVIHFHDNSVPPEEEILGAKLILEHREHWLRNEATALGAWSHRSDTTVFKNPFGDGLDGVWDAGITQGIGTGLRTMTAMLNAKK